MLNSDPLLFYCFMHEEDCSLEFPSKIQFLNNNQPTGLSDSITEWLKFVLFLKTELLTIELLSRFDILSVHNPVNCPILF